MAASTQSMTLVDPPTIDCAPGRLRATPDATSPPIVLDFDEIYREHFAFVWRSARRLGVRDAFIDDVVQEVFVIVHRRLHEFEGRSTLRTWLFGVTLRVTRDHKRSLQRKPTATSHEAASVDPDTLSAVGPSPSESAERAEAARIVHAILDEMDDERREVFVMSELEQIAMPEIAAVIGVNVNTCYARLRAARQIFEAAVARLRARQDFDACAPRGAR